MKKQFLRWLIQTVCSVGTAYAFHGYFVLQDKGWIRFVSMGLGLAGMEIHAWAEKKYS